MRNRSILGGVAVALIFTAAAADYGFGKMPVTRPRMLPVETFPMHLGSWHADSDLAVDPDVQEKLPTAKIVDRVYANSDGQSLDYTLVSASDDLDIHDPSICLPAQGWSIVSKGRAVMAGQMVNVLTVEQQGHMMNAVYWMTGYFSPKPSQVPLLQTAARVRSRVVGTREGDSLLVRIMSPATPEDDKALTQFVTLAMPFIEGLVRSGGAADNRKAFVS